MTPYYNVSAGGASGTTGYKHTPEVKLLLSEQRKGTTHSAATKALISASITRENNHFYGKTHSAESRRLNSLSHSKGAVKIYDLMGQYITSLPSVTTLARLVLSNQSTILGTIKSKSLFRGGWYFSLEPITTKEVDMCNTLSTDSLSSLWANMISAKPIRKAVFVFDAETGEFYRRYNGVIECAKDLKVSHNDIAKLMKSNGKTEKYMFSAHRIP